MSGVAVRHLRFSFSPTSLTCFASPFVSLFLVCLPLVLRPFFQLSFVMLA